MELRKIEIQKSKLLSIPEDERTFFIQLTYLLNDLIILHKLAVFSSNGGDSDESVLKKARDCQSLFFLIIQAGKLCEGWILLEKKFFGSGISREYEQNSSDLAKNGLKELKKYFGGGNNVLSMIRNKFAFHYFPSSEEIQNQIAEAPDSKIFEIFFSESQGNCLYHISYALILDAILKSIDTDEKKAIDNLLSDAIKVTGWFFDFLNGLVLMIAQKYFPETFEKFEKIEIPIPPNINDVSLPYFVSN